MAKRRKSSDRAMRKETPKLQRHLLGTMFDPTELLERTLSTGTVVRLRVEELAEGQLMVHEASRRRGEGPWVRWPEVEGVRSPQELGIEKCTPVRR